MDRRDFLKSTAAAGITGAALATPGQAGARGAPPPPASSTAQMERFLFRFDRGLEAIEQGQPLTGLLPAGARLEGPQARAGEALFRQSIRALYASGSFLELAPADQLHPGVQSRMLRLLPEIDAAVAAQQRLLSGLGASDLALLQRHLRRDPGLPMRLAEALDDAAIAGDLAPSKRGRLRLAATEVSTRLRTQPPALLIGEYLDKARRMEDRDGGAGATERAFMARMGEAAFWEYRSWSERESLAWRERLAAAGSAGPDPSGDAKVTPLSSRTASRGGQLLGLGVLVGGVCALTQLGGINFLVFGVTVGVVMMLIGLSVLLVAGVQRVAEGSSSRHDEKGQVGPPPGEPPPAASPPPDPGPPPVDPATAAPGGPVRPN